MSEGERVSGSGLTREEMRELIRDTVRETLLSLGIDARNPISMQADFRALREWRQAVQAARRNAALAVIGMLITAAGTALWLGIKAMAKGE